MKLKFNLYLLLFALLPYGSCNDFGANIFFGGRRLEEYDVGILLDCYIV